MNDKKMEEYWSNTFWEGPYSLILWELTFYFIYFLYSPQDMNKAKQMENGKQMFQRKL